MKGIIYKYTSPSKKEYIGQTIKTVKQRAGYNGIQYKSCTAFWRAIEKYGWNNFQCEILLEIDLPDLEIKEYLAEKEQYYINLYKTKVPNGYNISDNNDNTKFGQYHNSWLKLDEKEIIYLYTQERKTLCQIAEIFEVDWTVIQTRLQNNNIDTSFKASKAKDWRQDIEDDISNVIDLYCKQRLSLEKIGKLYNTNAITIATHLKHNSIQLSKGNSQPVNQFTLDGKFIARYNTMKEAAEANGISRGSVIKKALERQDKTCKSYKWEYTI